MIIGYSLSPGGLLLPYHLGILEALSANQYVTPHTPLAGSSAGSIAVCSHAAGIPNPATLEATIRVSDLCLEQGGARGRLLPLLRRELDEMLPKNAHEIINDRPGLVGLAHRELWPNNRPVLATQFATRECLMDAVMDSSTFPFFSTNWPARIVRRRGERIPRVVVDGFFSVPRERYGCPDFNDALNNEIDYGNDLDLSDLEVPLLGEKAGREGEVEVSARPKEEKEDYAKGTAPGRILYEESDTPNRPRSVVDRTITCCVFPHDTVNFTASDPHDRISPLPDPDGDNTGQMGNLFRLATQASSREELTVLYEKGIQDAERWIREEEARVRVEYQRKKKGLFSGNKWQNY